MLVVVVTLFLLVEFPLGVSMSIMIIENTADVAIVAEDTRYLLDLFLNFIILLSYPLNFFIYCAMSRQFRDTFCRLFVQRVASPVIDSRAISVRGTSTRGLGGADAYSQIPDTDRRVIALV